MTINSIQTYARLVDELAYRYESVASRSEVSDVVDRVRGELEPTSRHPEFLPVLVEKAARDRLTSLARTRGIGHATPEILFVCEHNEGRSQMAAAIAEHLSGGAVHVRSAGRTPTGLLNPTVVEALRERGIELDHVYPTPVEEDVLTAADVVVAMGADLPDLPGRRQVRWDIEDPHHRTLEIVRAIRDDIEGHVVDLLAELDVPVAAVAPAHHTRSHASAHRPLRDRLGLLAHA